MTSAWSEVSNDHLKSTFADAWRFGQARRKNREVLNGVGADGVGVKFPTLGHNCGVWRESLHKKSRIFSQKKSACYRSDLVSRRVSQKVFGPDRGLLACPSSHTATICGTNSTVGAKIKSILISKPFYLEIDMT